jgi:pre-mRNA-splicing helicase BRR2
MVPTVECDVVYVPITASFLRLDMELRANFQWDSNVHGNSELFWVFVEDADGDV